MKRRYIIYTLLMMLAFFLPTSCSNDDIVTGSDLDADKVCLNIGVKLPGASTAESRAMGDDGTTYYEFSDLYVAVFVDVNGVGYLEDFVKATNATWDATAQCWNFQVTLAQTETARRLHLIANYPNLTMGFGEEGQLIGRLLANGTDHDVYWNFCEVTKIDENLQLQNIPLLRNYVKIQLEDARTSKGNFEIDGYALYNVPTKGTVAPYNPSQTNKFANFVNDSGKCQTYQYMLGTEKFEGNEPFDDGTLISTVVNWKSPTAISYIYERSNRTATNPTCMLIKGRYDAGGNVTEQTPTTYYKLDFVYDDPVTHSKVYYNLLRNFIFKMKVNQVSGPGYNSVEEALKQPACNNIGGDAVAEDYTNISNGASRLFVSTTYKLLTTNQAVDVYYKYIPNLNEATTAANHSVTVTAKAGNVLKTDASIATTDETTGQYTGWRKVTLSPNNVPAVSQSQDIIFAAGGLQRKIELVLRTPYVLMVSTPDEVESVIKKPFDVQITLPTGIPNSLFPLRLFISSEKNTIFPDYGTNMPAEAQNGIYGFIKEVSWEDYNDSKTLICKFRTNCSNSATAVYVDNEYFARGSDSFVNPKLTRVEITKDMFKGVSVQQEYNSYPSALNNNGSNSRVDVTVKIGNQQVGSIKISRTSVTQINNADNGTIVLENPNGIDLSTQLVFTFNSKYRTGTNRWSNNEVPFTATITLGELLSGGALNFTH